MFKNTFNYFRLEPSQGLHPATVRFRPSCQSYAMNNSQRASETQSKKQNQTSSFSQKAADRAGILVSYDFVASRNGGVDGMKRTLESFKDFLMSDPTRRPSRQVTDWYNKAVAKYERAVKASIGMPTYSDSVVTQREAPKDIPTLPLSGYQLLSRTCLVEKLASSGTTAGGFFAELKASDLAPFTQNTYFRVRKVTSWTGTTYGNVGSGFAGVSVPASTANEGTEVMPTWSENWSSIGSGYAGIVTQYPLGDFPQIANSGTTLILTHFSALGGTGGVTGVPVIFHVEIECLV